MDECVEEVILHNTKKTEFDTFVSIRPSRAAQMGFLFLMRFHNLHMPSGAPDLIWFRFSSMYDSLL